MTPMTPNAVKTIFKRFKAENPHPTTELAFHNPFQLLIAVMLSAQATDKSVNKATEALFKTAKTPEQFLAMGEAKLKAHFKTLNYYQTKTKHVLSACQRLVDHFKSKVPDDRQSLESLPGVGRKTANVILNTCFGQPTLAVDTHIFRVANRTGLAHGKTPLAVETELLKVIPKPYQLDAHHWLILHGRYVCVARKPRCGSCLISDLCDYPDKTEAD